ncbi:MAG TPA: glycosyltransferase family 2 protein [Ktedonobacteraceae bacterium]
MPITVIIPTHNRAQLLDKTLASLCAQTQRQFSIIVVDHASTDDIQGLCTSYQDRLHLTYHWLAKEYDAPGIARHAGMQLVQTPLVVFLDCGIVVPSFFLAGHLAFHQQHPRHVGVGYYHGYKPWKPQDERWPEVLTTLSLDRATDVLVEHPEMRDERDEINLRGSHFAWTYGWTGNLSLQTRDYWSAGGFDLELEYAMEDLDLSYRLFRQGVSFAIVEDGWAIHLPHARPSSKTLRRMKMLGCEHCYKKARSLSWEVMLYNGVGLQRADAAFQYLTALGKEIATLPSTAPLASRYAFATPSLLIGGTLQDAPFYTFIALANEEVEATESVWSCFGLRIPLSDQSLQSVVITDIWKKLNRVFNKNNVPLLVCMILDLKRTAQHVFFIDSPGYDAELENACSTIELELLCQGYDLSFEILSPV